MHHVTYTQPSRKVILCIACHNLITLVNTVHAKAYGKLNDTDRIRLYRAFIKPDVEERLPMKAPLKIRIVKKVENG